MMQGNSKLWVVVGDIHGQVDNFSKIPELADADGVIISGDLTNLGGPAQAAQVLQAIGGAGLPVLAQIGNMDEPAVNEWLGSAGINIHCQWHQLAPGVGVLGIGGSTTTPFHTPSEFPDSSYAQWLRELWPQGASYEHRVLISHNPPHGTVCDDIGGGVHVGSAAVRRCLEDGQPEVCICGHIHEGKGVDHIGGTAVINPGQLSDGGYVCLRLADGVLTAELKQVSA